MADRTTRRATAGSSSATAPDLSTSAASAPNDGSSDGDLRQVVAGLAAQVAALTSSANPSGPATGPDPVLTALSSSAVSMDRQVNPTSYLWQNEPARALTTAESKRLPTLITELRPRLQDFSGEDDPLAILEFLAHIRDLMISVGCSETLAAAALPNFTKGSAQRLIRHQSKHYKTLVEVLISTYAPEEDVWEEWNRIRSLSRRNFSGAEETPTAFAGRIMTAVGRLGINPEAQEVRTIFENGLGTSLQAALRVQYTSNSSLRSRNMTQLARHCDNLLIMMGQSHAVAKKASVGRAALVLTEEPRGDEPFPTVAEDGECLLLTGDPGGGRCYLCLKDHKLRDCPFLAHLSLTLRMQLFDQRNEYFKSREAFPSRATARGRS
jgi:hypothetical protein